MTSNATTSTRWDARNKGFISPQRLNEMKRQAASNVYRNEISSSAVGSQNPNSAVSRPQASSPTRTASVLNFRNRASLGGVDSNKSPANNTTQTVIDISTASKALPMQSDQSRSLQNLSPPVTPQAEDVLPTQPQSSVNTNDTSNAVTPLHPEIRSVVQLSLAHAHKVYYSGPLIRHTERQPDGHRPTKDDGWRDVWAQLGGTTLSIWDMKEIEEANKRGEEVPPSYINITDAFVQVLGSVTVPATSTSPPQKYTNVVTLNTAGSNLILFSCPSTPSLISWSAALRLSAWEKSRLEEIYTAHLLRMSLSENDVWKDPRSPLVRGKMEGWVRIRLAGQTDWKRLWLVLQSGSVEGSADAHGDVRPSSPTQPRKNRMSALFSRPHSPQSATPQKPSLSFYASQKSKDRKKALLTMHDVTQAFAVYPERPELISRSTLIKMEGFLGDEEIGGAMRSREGWLLVMPEPEAGKLASLEMLKWLVGLHDTFELYGRPQKYIWDPRDPGSMMFSYPVGPHKDRLFLDRELAEGLDPRDDRTSAIRSHYSDILLDRMHIEQPVNDDLNAGNTRRSQDSQKSQLTSSNPETSLPQLPPLSFEGGQSAAAQPIAPPARMTLTPITERTREGSSEQSTSRTSTQINSMSPSSLPRESPTANRISSPKATSPGNAGILGVPITISPSTEMRNILTDTASPSSPLSRYSEESSTSRNTNPKSEEVSTNLATQPEFSEAKNIAIPLSASQTPASEDYRTMSPAASRSSRSSNVPVTPDLLKSSQINEHSLISSYSPNTDNDLNSASPNHTNITFTETSKIQPNKGPLRTNDLVTKDSDLIVDEPGALWYMQQHNLDQLAPQGPTLVSASEESGSDSETKSRSKALQEPPLPYSSQKPARPPPSSYTGVNQNHSPFIDSNISTSGSHNINTVSESENTGSRSTPLGRKPSGARALPLVNGRRSAPNENLDGNGLPSKMMTIVDASPNGLSPSVTVEANLDYTDADAMAAFSFLEQADSSQASSPKTKLQASPTQSVPFMSSNVPAQYKSSFALSKQAAERKARSQAQQAAHEAAVHRPGRPDTKAQVRQSRGAWESSDEEEEEEEEEDEEDEEEAESGSELDDPNNTTEDKGGLGAAFNSAMSLFSSNPPRQDREISPSGSGNEDIYQSQRSSRNLPQIPRGRSEEMLASSQRRMLSENRPEAVLPPSQRRTFSENRPETMRRTYYDDISRAPPQQPQVNIARQSVWSSVLDANRHQPSQPDAANARNTFVQLDSPAETMTKAFTPQGLLSAGLQDKEDRSAKKQEEVARETGASLINVPNKPPPPQTGLLGAITAHERERKREGGVGAALTERERERRFAEERQRKLDDFQRQQLEQQQQFTQNNPMYGMYGGLTPQMTGFNPMMGMPYNPQQQLLAAQHASMYFNPMFANPMTGFANPQHMYAAQQAAQAYQQAMMSMSIAGSQIGGEHGAQGAANLGTQSPPPNSMFGAPNTNMGFDPRMSMMSMGMGMPNMGMGFPSPLGMQMTGGNSPGFDPRFSMAAASPFDSSLRPPGDIGMSQQRASYGNSPLRGNSPANTGSPRYVPSDRLDNQLGSEDKNRS